MALFSRKPGFEFPTDQDRVTIVGATGSGKSTAGFWLFSQAANFDKMPWILVDYKGEEIIAEMIKRGDANVISLEKDVPKAPGIYVVKPDPQKPQALIDFLWRIYRRGRVGVVLDELMSVPNQDSRNPENNPVLALYTQGRSKRIPLWAFSQRPSRVSISAFSEATFIWEFALNRSEDRARVREYIPDHEPLFDDEKPLPRYYSKWWDSKRRIALPLNPVPKAPEILDTVTHRIDTMKRDEKL